MPSLPLIRKNDTGVGMLEAPWACTNTEEGQVQWAAALQRNISAVASAKIYVGLESDAFRSLTKRWNASWYES
jgi:hypothetical protein